MAEPDSFSMTGKPAPLPLQTLAPEEVQLTMLLWPGATACGVAVSSSDTLEVGMVTVAAMSPTGRRASSAMVRTH